MKFLADENVERKIVEMLRKKGYDVRYTADEQRSSTDEEILNKSNKEERVLITNDKDFGELVYLEKKISSGILLLRFSTEKSEVKARFVDDFISQYEDKVAKNFVVLSEKGIRIRKLK